MISSRLISDLDPRFVQAVCQDHIARCHAKGIELLITSTYRDKESQDALYAIGRTVDPSKRTVTKAQGGHSWHNYRCAWDVVPLVGGKCVWDERDPAWVEVVKAGKEAGAQAGADWPLFKDLPHFQYLPKTKAGPPMDFPEAATLWASYGTIFTV